MFRTQIKPRRHLRESLDLLFEEAHYVTLFCVLDKESKRDENEKSLLIAH